MLEKGRGPDQVQEGLVGKALKRGLLLDLGAKCSTHGITIDVTVKGLY